MKIFGHPVHMMLIHFPSALFPMDFVCSVLFRLMDQQALIDAAFYATSGGVVLGWLAVVTGALDLSKLVGSSPVILKRALLHGGINLSILIVYTVICYQAYQQYPQLLPNTNLILLIKGIALLLLALGNYLGGSLILKYKVNVDE